MSCFQVHYRGQALLFPARQGVQKSEETFRQGGPLGLQDDGRARGRGR